MKKMGGLAFILAFGLLAAGGAGVSRAEEAAAPTAEQEPEYTFGTVKSISGNQLVINEYDYDTGEEREATYVIDPAVELHNVAAVTEIAVGDEVDIDYLLKGSDKTAVVLSVAKPIEGDDAAE